MRNLTRGLTFIGLLTAGGAASAADLPSAKDLLDSWGVSLSGYVDGQFEYSSSPSPSLHVFDARHDSFSLNQAAFTLAMQPKEGWGGVVNVIAGEDARLINNFSTPSSNNNFDVHASVHSVRHGELDDPGRQDADARRRRGDRTDAQYQRLAFTAVQRRSHSLTRACVPHTRRATR